MNYLGGSNIRYMKLNSSRWSEFHITYCKSITTVFYVTVITKQLSLNLVSENRTVRQKLIMDLYGSGMSTNEISDYLNHAGIKTIGGKEWYTRIVTGKPNSETIA